MRRWSMPLTLLVVLMAQAVPLLAQTSQTGLLEGITVDASGSPIADAVLVVSRPDGSYPQSTVTDAGGRFRLAFLPPGLYSVTVRAGVAQGVATDVLVRADQVTRITVVVEETARTEEITVRASAPLIDTSSNEVSSTTLSAERIDLLPSPRLASDLVEFAPGASNSQIWGGSTDQANAYVVEGVNVNAPGFGGAWLLPNVDWIEEFQIKGLGAGAEFGNFQGGLINIVTRSGSNSFEGALRTNYESESLTASNLNVLEVGEEQEERFEVNAHVSGPIVRDKLYYFFAAQQVKTDFRVPDIDASGASGDVVFLPEQAERTDTNLFGKLTWQATDSNILNLTIGYDDREYTNRGLNAIDGPETAVDQDSPTTFYNLSWQKTFNSSNFLEVKMTGFEGDDDRLPRNGDLPAVRVLGGLREINRNAIYTRYRTAENNGIAVNWDSFWNLGGTLHHLKIGADYTEGTWIERRIRNGNLTWRPEPGPGYDPEDPATWDFISSDWGGGILLDSESVNSAFYVQDYVTLSPRLTLSAGLRYGRWEGDLTPGFPSGPKFQALEADAIAPRLGIVWDVDSTGRWVAKAHWGHYYQNLFALMFDRAEGGNVFEDTEFWDWIDGGLPDIDRGYTVAERDSQEGVVWEFFGSQPASSEVGPVVDYDQPYVEQLVLSLEHSLNENWKVGVVYVDRENEDIVALVDRNLESNYTLFQNVSVFDFPSGFAIPDQNGGDLTLPQLYISNDDILFVGDAPGLTQEEIDALTYEQDFLLTNVPEARREMDQFQLLVDGRVGDWSINGSLVWTDLTGNFYSVNGYDDPDGIGAGAFVEPNQQVNFDGDMPLSSDFELKLGAIGPLPWGFRGGAFLLYRSGDHWTPEFEIDRRTQDFVSSDGEFFDPDLLFGVDQEVIFLEQRGTREFDSYTELDVHLDRPIRLGKDLEVVLGIDVFNALNESAVSEVERLVNSYEDVGTGLVSDFGEPRLRRFPRTVRLSAAFSW
jgi:hypothetical protein